MTTCFSDDERRYFKKLFDLYDTDKSGAIGMNELRNLSKHLGAEMNDEQLGKSVKSINAAFVSGDGELSFDEFLRWLASTDSNGGDEFAGLKAKITAQGKRTLNNEQIQRLKEVFDHFDADASGSIDADELVNVFTSMGQEVSREDMEEMIRGVDDDDSGQIEFPEFMMLMCTNFGSKTFESDMQEAFATVDASETGKITVRELEQLIRDSTGGLLSDLEVANICQSASECVSNGYVEYMKWGSLWEACREES